MRSLDGIQFKPKEEDSPQELIEETEAVETVVALPENNVFSGFISNPDLESAHENFVSDLKVKSRTGIGRFLSTFPATLSSFSLIIRNIFRVRPRLGYKAAAVIVLVVALLGFSAFEAQNAYARADKLQEEAKGHLLAALDQIDAGNMAEAMSEVEKANQNISDLKLLAQSWGQDAKPIQLLSPKKSKIASEEKFLDSTKLILDSFGMINNTLSSSLKGSVSKGNSDSGLPLIDFSTLSSNMRTTLAEASNNLDIASSTLLGLKKDNPDYFDKDYDKALGAVKVANDFIVSAKTLSENGIPAFSGMNGGEKKYLLLFQNNSEIRGSGGFLGSFAVMTFKDGKLEKLDLNSNIYKMDKAFSSQTPVEPPKELKYITSAWAMRDSNFAIDFRESATKIEEFYKLETGQQVDGVLALDTTMFINLLKITGPIDVPEYQMKIGSDNFLTDVQYEVEKGYFDRPGGKQENEPKKILSYMMPKFLDKLSSSLGDKDQAVKVAEVFSESMNKKDLLFYFNTDSLQNFIEKEKIGGAVESSLYDYVFVHNTNIGGMKSSLNVTEQVNQKVSITDKGQINSELEVLRHHTGSYEWPDGTNINLVRILLPQNSKINSFVPVSGNFYPFFDKKNASEPVSYNGEEAGKAKISFWQNTVPGEATNSKTIYTPNYTVDTSKDSFTYSIFIQKEPGANPDDYTFELNYPAGFIPTNVQNFDAVNNKIILKFKLEEDKQIRIKFEKDKG